MNSTMINFVANEVAEVKYAEFSTVTAKWLHYFDLQDMKGMSKVEDEVWKDFQKEVEYHLGRKLLQEEKEYNTNGCYDPKKGEDVELDFHIHVEENGEDHVYHYPNKIVRVGNEKEGYQWINW